MASHALFDEDSDLPPVEELPTQAYFIIKQDVTLDINFREKRIDGTTDIILVVFDDKLEHVDLDAAQCDIDTKNITVTELREAHGSIVEGPKRRTGAEYNDPYDALRPPDNYNWTAEHHDLRRIRARRLFNNRATDVPAEDREFKGCTPAYGSLKVNLRAKGGSDRPKVIIRKQNESQRQYKISIPFTNRNGRDGVHFVGVDPLDTRYPHMYTRHSLQPGTASCIFPCIDDHGQRCDWRITIKHPKTMSDALRKPLATQGKDTDAKADLSEEDKLREMTVVCSGFLVEESTDPKDERKRLMTFEPEKKTSVQKLGFAVGPFEHVDISSEFRSEEDEIKLGISALRVHAYCLPRRAEWVRNTCIAMTMAADHFSWSFAKYPFGNFKLIFLEDLVEDTVALHSMAFASNRLLYPEDIIDTEFDTTRKLVYTLAYQWTGINMIPNTRNDIWISIGMAHFMTELFMKRLCGNNEHRFRMKTMSDHLVEIDIERPSLYDLGSSLHLGESEIEFMHLKSSLVFFILDKRLNKASSGHNLMRILAKLLTKVQIESSDKASILKTPDFRTRCEKAAKCSLETFWDQWIYASGAPRFDVKARFNKKRLCVELTLNQIQHQVVKKPELQKADFMRLIKERRNQTPLGEVQPIFSGSMTIRIHEADGTPYEHIIEIKEDAARATKFEIPYNTKYKRLKRTRRMKEKLTGAAANADAQGETEQDALTVSLGDGLSTPEEQAKWEIIDWDPETERKMDQESYEWIRVDADFEWVAAMKHTLEPYMYVSQLQQDRDVVAQQDAILYLATGPLHPIASGFLVKTIMDRRYFHGIRTMAAAALTRQSNIKDLPMLGLRQLMLAYRDMFCYENSNQPRPNDFSDKQQYKVRCAIIQAIAEVRDANTHRCPLDARQFVLDQLLYNNNEKNSISDHHWIALLVKTLAISMIPSKKDEWVERQRKLRDDAEDGFLEKAIEQIERVLRRDEWTYSYHNIWTIAGLDAKQRLMKAEVIPKNLLDFAQYLIDGTADTIRIKCFEALIDLGAMTDHALFSLLVLVLTTDRSPHVRSKLIEALVQGLAAIALGEHAKPVEKEESAMDLDDPLLVVQDSEKEIEARQEMFARRQNLDSALIALRKEMDETYASDQRHYRTALRKALDHQGLTRTEIESLLDIAAMMFEEASTWILTLQLPKTWKAERSAQATHDRLLMKFTSHYRIEPKQSKSAILPPPPLPAVEAPAPAPLARAPSIKINTNKPSTPRTSFSDAAASQPPPPPKPASFSAPKEVSAPAKPVKLPAAPVPKRPFDDSDDDEPMAAKRTKTSTPQPIIPSAPGRKRKMITLKTKNPGRLAVILGQKPPVPRRTSLPGMAPKKEKEPTPEGVSASIPPKHSRKPLPIGGVAGDSARKPLPGSGDTVRKPLPTGGSSMSPPPPPPEKKSMKINTNTARASPKPLANGASGSPAPATPLSAGGRPKIKIIRKSTNPATGGSSQSPPAP
ncbi:transcription initiation factor [Emericellopsis atlantica]|uniref:Transcription initiation factor TFIID subunit 2 n=1 Tax=Emericellopsis atlantica TaxID=2614577 RepID=A0A9P7ZUT7_9HYPO|nr:transcription initiation factor [Emericellopsis atlantica]KAG9258262.1 transcription initiation factor [Emericellopsis atlantica]